MIGTKDVKMVNTGRKIVNKYKDNFSNFTEHDFFVRVFLMDKDTGIFVKALEIQVNSDNCLDYILNGIDFGDYKVEKIEFSASGR